MRPDGELLEFQPWRLHEGLGVSEGTFPAGEFRLSEDLAEARFDRNLPAAIFDPCADVFVPVTVREIAYVPATGQLRGRIEPSVQQRLSRCLADLPDKAESPERVNVVLLRETRSEPCSGWAPGGTAAPHTPRPSCTSTGHGGRSSPRWRTSRSAGPR